MALPPVPAAEVVIMELAAEVMSVVVGDVTDVEVAGVVTVTREGKKEVKLGKSVGVTTGPERARQVTETSGCTKMSCWPPKKWLESPLAPMNVQSESSSDGMMV